MAVRLTFYLLFPVLFLFSFTVKAESITDFNQRFSQQVALKLAQMSIPGGAYVIVKNNQIAALETFGYTDQSQSQKVNSHTVFRLASVSKTFSATVTTMLALENKLSLNDPITKYVPEFTLADKTAADKIQIHHLLSHSSGLIPNAYDNLLHENWDMQRILSWFNKITPLCQPDQCYGYQNIAYSLVQPAIETIQPEPFAELLNERIFAPLKMADASVGLKPFISGDNYAKPHVLIDKKQGKYIWTQVAIDADFYKVEPAAGVNASISDLANWLIANLGYQPDILSKNLLAELTEPRIKTTRELNKRYWREYLTDAYYGYGWRIYQFDDYPVYFHSGWVRGYRAAIGYSPDLDLGFAILLNAESSVISELTSGFWANAKSLQ
ncbi:beta-lactamase family protein [Catenovulum sp. 2E275]|uniref:serine hydrolase domain-containing protein n=1 Tax=Catenovulum sp. 2E275 TaxID=2980497 RepID=UPI0021D00499|nr:serine hydrolase domain-containing protein [Catenovulum sp. 2E275]MCU4675776.1 beta-lactamase family protein [Catenovulum sp. 2E275]